MAKQERTLVTYNFDRPGSDYKVLIPNQPRASWCGFFCANESKCKSYTYVPTSGNGECHLKTNIPARVSRSGFVSGFKEF